MDARSRADGALGAALFFKNPQKALKKTQKYAILSVEKQVCKKGKTAFRKEREKPC
jgi:hypothetical protein